METLQKNIKSAFVKAIVLIVLGLGYTTAHAQETKSSDPVFTAVEHSASFKGGVDAFYAFLAKTIHYPAAARDHNVQGKVILTFIVEQDGSLTDVKVLRGIGSGCDEEAVRAVKLSPKWNPGTQNGKPVRQQYTVPVSFSLAK